jgi:acetyl esterase
MADLTQLRKRAGAFMVDGFFQGASRLGRLHPRANPQRHGVEVLRDIAYQAGGRTEHLLDVWRPLDRSRPSPALLYIHGGGFRILSKDTHWIMALAFARRGFTVFNISYRLAPAHPFPAAVQDACAAYVWVAQHAHEYGADLGNLVLAGESAGGNLVTSLTLAACFQREEPYARAVFETGVVPKLTLPACGMLQVSDPGRVRRRKPHLSKFVEDRLAEVSHHYLHGSQVPDARTLDLADPLLVLERDDVPDRPLPAFFAPVGTRDPLLDDTRRLGLALQKRGVPCDVRYYPGELHAFHALVFRPLAQQCWRDTFAFVDRHLDVPTGLVAGAVAM